MKHHTNQRTGSRAIAQPAGVGWLVTARTPSGRQEYTVATERNAAGFRGRQWEDEHGNQHGTLLEVMQAAIDVVDAAARVDRGLADARLIDPDQGNCYDGHDCHAVSDADTGYLRQCNRPHPDLDRGPYRGMPLIAEDVTLDLIAQCEERGASPDLVAWARSTLADREPEVDPASVIARALTPVPGLEPVTFQHETAARVMTALTSAGFRVTRDRD